MHVSLRGLIGTGYNPELSFPGIRPRNGHELIAALGAFPGDAKKSSDSQIQYSRSVAEWSSGPRSRPTRPRPVTPPECDSKP